MRRIVTIVESAVVTPAPALIRAKGKPIFGRATFSNGAPCSFSVPVFGLEGNAKVALVDAQGKVLVQPIEHEYYRRIHRTGRSEQCGGHSRGMRRDEDGSDQLAGPKPGALRVNLRTQRRACPGVCWIGRPTASPRHGLRFDPRSPRSVRARMPGNFGAVASTGSSVRLGSYGGVDVEVATVRQTARI